MDDAKKLKILFFTPFAGRTGSEMLLWYLLNQLDVQQFDSQLISFLDGELLREMPSHVKTHFVPKTLSYLDKVKHKLGINRINEQVKAIHQKFDADVWYLNTLTMPEMVSLAHKLGVRVITHVHELPLSYNFLTINEFKELIDYSALLIACSNIAGERLRECGAKNVQVLSSFIDCSKIVVEKNKNLALRKNLDIAEDDFVWVMAGPTVESKGFALLPAIASQIDNPKVHLIWLGKRWDAGTTYWVEKKIENIQTTKVHLLGAKSEDYYDYLQMADGFMMTSREESLGMVNVEAAFLQKPVVSFNSGGVTEFVQEGMGKIVDSWNVVDFVAAMQAVMNGTIPFDPQKAQQRAWEYDVSVQAPKWEQIMTSFRDTIK